MEKTVSGDSSGLQYLGDGNNQANWKTVKDFTGACKKLALSFGCGYTAAPALFGFK